MARVLAMSSFVASGHVGLGAVVPGLQALGHEVVALPTILLSNHPGHPRFAGEAVDPDLLDRMIAALSGGGDAGSVAGVVGEGGGFWPSIDAILIGYMPSPDHVDVAHRTIELARRKAHRHVPVLCDPIIGDDPSGRYVTETVAAAIRDRIMPLADITTPNRFELSWMSGHPVATAADALQAARMLAIPTVLATSIPIANPSGDGGDGDSDRHGESAGTTTSRHLANLLYQRASNPDGALLTTVPRWDGVPHGTGDLMTALFLGHLLAGRSAPDAAAIAASGVAAAAEASIGRRELQLVRQTSRWAAARPLALTSLSVDRSADYRSG
ncbi:MAG: pyridoxal kinase [Hyphomicrobiaceae bacterium]|nr:pyridoxal kinase [Hyphomicrobiaceae bacterium]